MQMHSPVAVCVIAHPLISVHDGCSCFVKEPSVKIGFHELLVNFVFLIMINKATHHGRTAQLPF